MSVDTLARMLLWCTIINYAILLLWVAAFFGARQRLRRLHGRWFRLGEETFDALHYGGMGLFKLGILLFNLAPYLALRIVA